MATRFRISGPDTELRRLYQAALADGPPHGIEISVPESALKGLMSRHPMGQMEWSDVFISFGLSLAASTCYDWIKVLMAKTGTAGKLKISDETATTADAVKHEESVKK